jgi:hypothetical protein
VGDQQVRPKISRLNLKFKDFKIFLQQRKTISRAYQISFDDMAPFESTGRFHGNHYRTSGLERFLEWKQDARRTYGGLY